MATATDFPRDETRCCGLRYMEEIMLNQPTNTQEQPIGVVQSSYTVSITFTERPNSDQLQRLKEAKAASRQPWQDIVWTGIAKLYFCQHFKFVRQIISKAMAGRAEWSSSC
jgi:hypothetical protein